MEADSDVPQSPTFSGDMTNPMPRVISLEGPIATGKSTLFESLEEELRDVPGIAFVEEPVKEWEAKGFLAKMYSGEISKGEFQHMVLMSLTGKLLKTLARGPYALIITERSPWSNYHIFGKANLEGESLELFEHTWNDLLEGLPSQLDVRFLYLRTYVDEAQKRIAERGRPSEQKIPREYMQTLHDNHETWIKLPEMQDRHHTIDTAMGIDAVREAAIEQICAWLTEAGEGYIKQRNSVKESQYVTTKLTAMAHNAQSVCKRLKKQDRALSAEVS